MRLSSRKPSSVLRWTDAAATESGEAAHGVRYDAARASRGHLEAWYLQANDPRARRAISLSWTIWAGERDPRRAIAEAWAVAFGTRGGHVATKTSVPFERAVFRRDSLGVVVDGASLSETSARGRVESGGRAIAYDLDLVHLPAATHPAESTAASRIPLPTPNARVRGVAHVEDETWSVDDWPATVGHSWGRAHSGSQAWGRCSSWDEEDDFVIEGFTTHPRVGVFPLPARTVIALRHGDVTSLLTGSLSLVHSTRTEGVITPRRWRFRGRSRRVELEGEIWADTDDLVGFFCSNPDGTTVHRLESKLARAEVTLRLEGRRSKTLRSQRAALDITTRDADHGVRMHV
jgi:hypothetical protein